MIRNHDTSCHVWVIEQTVPLYSSHSSLSPMLHTMRHTFHERATPSFHWADCHVPLLLLLVRFLKRSLLIPPTHMHSLCPRCLRASDDAPPRAAKHHRQSAGPRSSLDLPREPNGGTDNPRSTTATTTTRPPPLSSPNQR